MQVTLANLTPSTASASRQIKNYIMIAIGALQTVGGAIMVAFVTTQLKTEAPLT